MILYANGDSHTAPDFSYAGIVAKELGLEFINQAQGGSSNSSIIRRTCEFNSKNKREPLECAQPALGLNLGWRGIQVGYQYGRVPQRPFGLGVL